MFVKTFVESWGSDVRCSRKKIALFDHTQATSVLCWQAKKSLMFTRDRCQSSTSRHIYMYTAMCFAPITKSWKKRTQNGHAAAVVAVAYSCLWVCGEKYARLFCATLPAPDLRLFLSPFLNTFHEQKSLCLFFSANGQQKKNERNVKKKFCNGIYTAPFSYFKSAKNNCRPKLPPKKEHLNVNVKWILKCRMK